MQGDAHKEIWRDDSFARVWLDVDGLPSNYYKKSGTLCRSPTTVCLFGLQGWHQSGSGDPQHGLRAADWLVKSAVPQPSGGLAWPFPMDFAAPGHLLKAPWVSMLTQGLALSVLARAYLTTGRQRYREFLHRAVDYCRATYEHECASGSVWFAEYPGGPSVLNGHMFTLFGLVEAKTISGISAGPLVVAGRTALELNLDRFELILPGFRWSRYDDGCIWYAGEKYHGIHIRQLRALAATLLDPALAARADRWASWQHQYGRRGARVLLHKAVFGLQKLGQVRAACRLR
jgi:hypothetical protein